MVGGERRRSSNLFIEQAWPNPIDVLFKKSVKPVKRETVYPGVKLGSLNSIRLLKLHDTIQQESAITCTLQPFDLEDNPRYYALSYAKGHADAANEQENGLSSGDKDQQITCNDQPFFVSENLHDALLELRQSGFPDWLWVDAICVDQSHAEERASHVSIMGQIHQSSIATIAWLGKDETGIEDIQWAIDVMIPTMLQMDPGFWDSPSLADPELETVLRVGDLNHRIVRIKTFLASRTWFNDVWVAQQVALAPAVWIRAGKWYISFTELTNLAILLSQLLWDRERFPSLPGLDERCSAAMAFLESLHRLRGLVPHKVADQTLLQAESSHETSRFLRETYAAETEMEMAAAWMAHLLSSVRNLEGSEGHEKIYSVIGLANFFNSNIDKLVKPDYDQPVSVVYIDMTAALLLNSRNLSILAHVGDLSNHHLTDLPSWVVDYSSSNANNPILGFGKAQATDFDASLSCKLPRFPRMIEGTRLTLVGADFDHVDLVSPVTLAEVINDVCHFEEFMKFISLLSDRYHDSQSRTEVLWRVMMMDSGEIRGTINHPAPPSFARRFQSWLINMIGLWVGDAVRKGWEIEAANESARQFFYQLYPNTEIDVPEEIQESDAAFASYHRTQMLPFVRSVEPKMYGRKLFQTTSNLCGVASRSIQNGDQVWLVCDSRTPLILRPKSGAEDFLLVGEAYVHGFMHGEMVDECRKMGQQIRTVTIV